MKLEINDELKNLIPPLREDEYHALETSILQDGIRDPLVVWDKLLTANETYERGNYSICKTQGCKYESEVAPFDEWRLGDGIYECPECGYGIAPFENEKIIVDGHNRYEIAQEWDLDFEIVEKDFENIEQAKDWMDANQLGRRNLTPDQRKILIGRRYNREKKKQGAPKNNNNASKQRGQNVPFEKTSEKLAKENNISSRTVKRYAKDAEKFEQLEKEDPETANDIWSGETTLKDVKKKEKKKKRDDNIKETKKKILEENKQIKDKYDVLTIDPPWDYSEKGGFTSDDYDSESNRGSVDYPTMGIQKISEINLPLKDDAVVFLWTTHAFLRDAFDLLGNWGLEYKATMVWDKDKMGMGRTIRMQCEFCLLAKKGDPLIEGSSIRDIIREKRREHSRKPEKFYEIVRQMTTGRRLDYFSRENIEGFESYGAEEEKF